MSGPGSSVGIATGYGLGRPGIESPWGEISRTCPDRSWGPPSLLYNGYRVFPGGIERLGRDADPSPPSSAVGHERVELYLYSLYGPYCLYRASVPVQRCTLPLFYGRWRLSKLPLPAQSFSASYLFRCLRLPQWQSLILLECVSDLSCHSLVAQVARTQLAPSVFGSNQV